MAYHVKEIVYTLQGEGANAGRAAVFLRFAGCNLWSGREADRPMAICPFCDTDFVGTNGPGGGKFETAAALAEAAVRMWRPTRSGERPFIVCTGGEPLLQLDVPAIAALHAAGFEVALETNGTLPIPPGIDWLCVSPKAGADCVVRVGDELKLVFPQEGPPPEHYATWQFRHYFLQPMHGPDLARNTMQAVQYCLEHPQWRLGMQLHKLLGLP